MPKYISTRKRVIDYLKPILFSSEFEADKVFFIANASIELAVKKELIEELLEDFIDAGIIKFEYGMIKNTNFSKKDIISSEIKEEFKEVGI
jgi:hypothetical protein